MFACFAYLVRLVVAAGLILGQQGREGLDGLKCFYVVHGDVGRCLTPRVVQHLCKDIVVLIVS